MVKLKYFLIGLVLTAIPVYGATLLFPNQISTTGGSSGQVLSISNGITKWVATSTTSGGTPGGSDTQVQFNDAGSFGGSANLTWDGTYVTIGDINTFYEKVYAGGLYANASIVLHASGNLVLDPTVGGNVLINNDSFKHMTIDVSALTAHRIVSFQDAAGTVAYLTDIFGYPFPSNATSSILTFSGGALFTASTTFSATTTFSAHIFYASSTVALTLCGTGPSQISGGDQSGKIITGTGVISSCTKTFDQAFPKAPACYANDETAILVVRAVSTISTVVFSVATTFGGDTISFVCEATQ